MGLPVSFLLGLLAVAVYEQTGDALPGDGSLALFGAYAWLLIVPWALARLVASRFFQQVASGRVSPRMLALTRLHVFVVPLCYAALLHTTALPDLASRSGAGSQLLQLALLIGPLVWMEVSMRLGERKMRDVAERAGIFLASGFGALRLPMVAFVAVPFVMLAAAADLLATHRQLWVFFHVTTLGTTTGLLLLVLVLSLVLPLLFRWLMPVSRELPARVGDDLRATAERLGFPGRSVLSMHTGHRMINAALVGPARPRYLILTDGLLSLLDPHSLRGVVAHEVGHAKANHPALLVLLFAGIPLLLLHPVLAVEIPDISSSELVVAAAVIAVLAWLVLRLLAHRFEYEADQLSSEALGSARDCVQALLRVGEMSASSVRRSSFRHPSERRRIDHLVRCENDPDFRARFWRRGVWVRRSIYAAALVALGCSAWFHARVWSLDSALMSYYSGDVAAAHRQLTADLSHLPQGSRAMAAHLAEESACARELGFERGSWEDMSGSLARDARVRAVEVLQSSRDPGAALPWLGLALNDRQPEAWLQALYMYASTFPEDEARERARIETHLLELDVPDGVRRVVESLRDQ